jgi:lipopolysaccharide biosynthesis glycosyltransferase
MIPMFVGFDPREAAAYHAFVQSVIEASSCPVSFTPLSRNAFSPQDFDRRDGSNDFTYLRFRIPELMSWKGWALFADGDMICRDDITELWDMRDDSKAVMVCKHNYQTKRPIKYLGQPNRDYPRKNWSSVVLWNCAHAANRTLNEKSIREMTGAELHRFDWLVSEEIGTLPLEWNWLVEEYSPNLKAKLLHYTLGIPAFEEYAACDGAAEWHATAKRMNAPRF